MGNEEFENGRGLQATGQVRGRPFRKGKSGNPGGRPVLLEVVRAAARSHGLEAIGVLATAMTDEDPRVRVAAAVALLERGFGKPQPTPTGAQGVEFPTAGLVVFPALRRVEDEPEAPWVTETVK